MGRRDGTSRRSCEASRNVKRNRGEDGLRLELLNQLPEIERLNDAFVAFAEARSVPRRVIRQFGLVFDELLTNIISYAYADDREHRIQLEVRCTANKVSARITDNGVLFNPLKHRSPPVEAPIDEWKVGGLGIKLVRNVMDELSYVREGDENIVDVAKYLDPPAVTSA